MNQSRFCDGPWGIEVPRQREGRLFSLSTQHGGASCEGRRRRGTAHKEGLRGISWCGWEQGSVPPGRIALLGIAKQRSWGLLCQFVPVAREAGLEKATKWLRCGRQVPCEGQVQGWDVGKETGAPASPPAAAPPWPPQPRQSQHTGRRNKKSISRESVWKIPSFIRQADVQADSFIPMHTITGICVGRCPSSLPPAMLSAEMLTPPTPTPRHHSRRGLGFLGKMKRSPSSSFLSPDSQSSPKKAWRELGWGPQSSWD